ncbi:hypothetical protein EVAR_55320_1 [Eumeta japonica]|uniref:Uncharacterized protein n=1 Tax=Eumeta variegata TaxID=151549 RepID=A0A4C1Z7Q7_EUMVA|nr:hypothetical protein EVAR_55320_1 [Eumeta japonica]
MNNLNLVIFSVLVLVLVLDSAARLAFNLASATGHLDEDGANASVKIKYRGQRLESARSLSDLGVDGEGRRSPTGARARPAGDAMFEFSLLGPTAGRNRPWRGRRGALSD